MAGDEGQPLKPPHARAAHADGREEMEDQAARLPDDVLADILRRVPPRWLAASRCVCRAWRDAVDGRRLLRVDLLPLSLAGIFVHFDEHKFPEFLARPSSSAASVSGNLSFLPSASPNCGYYWQRYQGCDWKNYNIKDHCNGLLLLRNNCVVNPATRHWSILPKGPGKRGAGNVRYRARLVYAYDPMVSPYYKVFKIPTLAYHRRGEEVDPSMEESQWPPSVCKMFVYSSKSGCWEEKDFVREGDAAGTAGKIRAGDSELSAACFRGALYLHCQTDFLMRVSLSNNTYSVIKPPMGLNAEDYLEIKIAKSGNGLYFVALDASSRRDMCWLRVWILNESCGQMVWMLKHDKDLKHMPCQLFRTPVKWVLEDINYSMFRDSEFQQDNNKETDEEKFDWNSDGDVEDKNMVNHGYSLQDRRELFYDIELLGFHPNKEIVFLSASQMTCLAYHLNGSKIEEIGNIYPKDCLLKERIKSFLYTPCWMQEFSGSN